MPADDEWHYERRRIPITSGWGPCKRTDWVPVEEHYRGRNSRTVRTFLRVVGLDPESAYVTRSVNRNRPMLDFGHGGDDDNGRDLARQYAGFRERELHPGLWRYHHVDDAPAPAQSHDIDRVIANDLQELEQFRAQRFENRMGELNAEINAIDVRYWDRIQEYQQALAADAEINGRGVGDPQRQVQEIRDAVERMQQNEGRRNQAEERRDVERRVQERMRVAEQMVRDLRRQHERERDRDRRERDHHRRRVHHRRHDW
ncbi:hypothetical protein LTS17_006807 [Exophiala oligosperma]